MRARRTLFLALGLAAYLAGCDKVLGIHDLPPADDLGGSSGSGMSSPSGTSGANTAAVSSSEAAVSGGTSSQVGPSSSAFASSTSGMTSGSASSLVTSNSSSVTSSSASSLVTSSSSSGPPCGATVATGALSTSNGYQTWIGAGGFTYPYDDGNGSTACLSAGSFCGQGTTAPGNLSGTVWGAGIGLQWNAPDEEDAVGGPYAIPSSVGISYAVSSVPPQGLRLVVDDAGTEYCVTVTSAQGEVPWSSFSYQCWLGTGAALAGPPTASTKFNFQVPAPIGASSSFDFCVTQLSFDSAPLSGVLPGLPCETSASCDPLMCTYQDDVGCVDWKDGAGPICSCTCDTGLNCKSGCCWQVNGTTETYYACRDAAACSAINQACTANYECLSLQSACNGYQAYCVNSECVCGCALNSECESGCCAYDSLSNLVCSAPAICL